MFEVLNLKKGDYGIIPAGAGHVRLFARLVLGWGDHPRRCGACINKECQ